MKIAIVSADDSSDKKGAFIATHNRIKHLLVYNDLEITVFLVQAYETLLIRTLRKSQKRLKEDFFIYDGVKYNNLWFDFSLTDYLFRMRTMYQGPFFFIAAHKWTRLFKDFDFISAHSYEAGIIARNVKKKYNIPFVITWHGSDIHSAPFSNSSVYKWTKRLLEEAECNFFVSQNLSEISEKITGSANKAVLYNGVDRSIFRRYNETELEPTRKLFSIHRVNKNIAFIGNLIPIKNADKLPDIFNLIKSEVPEAVFFIIGDGGLKNTIENECKRLKIRVYFLGNQNPSLMPILINCMDLVLLPSKNEGLPLVALESLACGVPVIGSRVGGIAEVIGLGNTVEINQLFVRDFAKLAIEIINNRMDVKLNHIFDWSITAQAEVQHYRRFNRCR